MQVQYSRVITSYMQPGTPKFDYMWLLQQAAHDENWKAIFTPLHISEQRR